MSDLRSFTLFPRLPVEIRLQIWESTLFPRVFSLVPQGYNWTEDTSAVPWSLIRPSPTNNSHEVASARFLMSDSPSHVALGISRESRHLVLSRGYRVWKVQNRQGHVRNVFWNPVVDTILFPPVRLVHRPKVYYDKWLILFSFQYPEETKIVNNVAMYTSMAIRSRILSVQWTWIKDLAKFQSLRELVIVVDEEAERSKVQGLIERNKSQYSNRLGPWNLPQAVEEWLAQDKLGWPDIQRVPAVRVVESAERILDDQSLQICLHCNPCKYLGMG